MVGITSYGAYVPMLRLPLAAIGGGKPGGPEKAVANWDEDAVTMAIAAAIECLRGVDRASVDGVEAGDAVYVHYDYSCGRCVHCLEGDEAAGFG